MDTNSKSAHVAQSVVMRQGTLWTLISCSIHDKTALNVLIYLQAPPDSLSFCLTDAPSNTFATRRGGRQVVGGVVMLRHGGGLASGEEGEGDGGRARGVATTTEQNKTRKGQKTI